MLHVIYCVQMVTRYQLQLQMGVAFMDYFMNVTISTSYYNRADIHYNQIIQYERILVTAEN